MYFLRRLRPLEVAGDRVRSLRASLNAPVLTTPDLPAGPGRALIVVHREARGRMDATVGVRSIATGEIAYWSFDGELLSEADLSVASDAALTFAESLGFLFDEAPLAAGAAAEKVFRAWVAGDDDRASPLERVAAIALDGATDALFSNEPPELDLDDLVSEALPRRERDPPRATPSPAASPPSRAVLDLPRPAPAKLSKFRPREVGATVQAAAPLKTPQRRPLARVQLVKRRSPEDERKLAIRRLLTSF
jgi:hypothetical protein